MSRMIVIGAYLAGAAAYGMVVVAAVYVRYVVFDPGSDASMMWPLIATPCLAALSGASVVSVATLLDRRWQPNVPVAMRAALIACIASTISGCVFFMVETGLHFWLALAADAVVAAGLSGALLETAIRSKRFAPEPNPALQRTPFGRR